MRASRHALPPPRLAGRAVAALAAILAAGLSAAQAPLPVYREIYSLGGFPDTTNCAFWDGRNDGALDMIVGTNDYEYVIANEQPIGPDFVYQGRITRPTEFGGNRKFWQAMEVADFNGDDLEDYVFDANFTSGSVVGAYIRHNNGGGISAVSNIVSSPTPRTRDWAPFDGDGDGDVDLAGITSSAVSFYANNGANPPVFTATTTFSIGGCWRVEVGDVDNDGRTDIVALTDAGVRWLQQLPSPVATFTLAPASDFAFSPRNMDGSALAVGDFNGDGATDVAVGGAAFNSSELEATWVSFGAPGVGANFSEPALVYSPPSSSFANSGARMRLKAVDLNGDGRDEILVSRWIVGPVGQFPGMPGVAYFWLDANNEWRHAPVSEAIWASTGVDAADLDGDGLLEIMTVGMRNSLEPFHSVRVFGASPSNELLRVEQVWAEDASGDGSIDRNEPGTLRVALRRQGEGAPAGDVTVRLVPSGFFGFHETVATLPMPADGGVVVASFPFTGFYEIGGGGDESECQDQERARAPVSIETEWPGGFGRSEFVGRFGRFYVTFMSQENDAVEPIPDGTGEILTRSFQFQFPRLSRRLEAMVSFDIEHPHRGDLDVWTTRPESEGASTVFNGDFTDALDNLSGSFVLTANTFPGDGEYALNVEDNAFGEAGFLTYAAMTFALQVYVCEPWNSFTFPKPTFESILLPAADPNWSFAPGDGFFSAPAGGAASEGFEIAFSPDAPTTLLGDQIGGWSNGSLAAMDFQPGRLYAARAWLGADQASDPGASARLRAQAVTSSMDYVYNINDNQDGPHGLPTSGLRAYAAYFRPIDADVLGQHVFAFDASDNGNPFGTTRTVAMRGLELGSIDANAYAGSENALLSASAGGFGPWSYVNYGPFSLEGDIPLIEGGAGDASGGVLRHYDDADLGTQSGGAAEWLYAPGENLQAVPGAFYRASWTIAAGDGPADGGYPRARLATRSAQAALSIENVLRGDGPAYDAFAASPSGQGVVDQYWTGHDSSIALNGIVADDLIAAFGLFNFANPDPTRDGSIELRAIRIEELSPDDPNTP